MDRVENFENKHFGMFIHFGLYSELSKGEWTWFYSEESRRVYPECFVNFNPSELNWKKIVSVAKETGMKYIVLTTRHHDGFSLYDTRGLSDYDVMHTPYGRDIVREFVDECNRQDIMPLLYHTMHDWQLPLFQKDFNAYLQYHRKSIEILCTRYGEIGGLWFDGMWYDRKADWQEDALYSLIRKYQPNAIIINNSGLKGRGKRGNPELDSITFEQGNLQATDQSGFERHLAMEVCQTMNHHWGDAGQDIDYKSNRQLVEMLAKCRGAGANYLLNIGPDGMGNITPMQLGILNSMRIWVNLVKEPFDHGKVSASYMDGKDFVLDTENGSYAFIHDLPMLKANNVMEGGDLEHPIRNIYRMSKKVKTISWMDNNELLAFQQSEDCVSLSVTGFPYGRHLIVRCAVIKYE
jgi:alpha-L-fucosidase